MTLTIRPTGLGSGIDKDRPDYTVHSGGWEVGRIYKTRGGPDHLRWFWSMNAHGPMTRSNKVATLEEAKAQFRTSWDAWKAWAKLEERGLGGEHRAILSAFRMPYAANGYQSGAGDQFTRTVFDFGAPRRGRVLEDAFNVLHVSSFRKERRALRANIINR